MFLFLILAFLGVMFLIAWYLVKSYWLTLFSSFLIGVSFVLIGPIVYDSLQKSLPLGICTFVILGTFGCLHIRWERNKRNKEAIEKDMEEYDKKGYQ
jgi:F0F1-type ATP synthase assembly protein I